MLKVLALPTALVLSLLPAVRPPALCLSCPQIVQGPPCQEFWRADAVFVGYVTEAVGVEWPRGTARYSEFVRLTARLVVEESFRGVEGSEVTFEMNDCPYPFRLGERYLVYANHDRDGKLYQSIGFSRTRPLSEAGDDITYIRGLRRDGVGGRVYGTVHRNTGDYRLRAGSADVAERRGSGGVLGVIIIAEGEARSYEAKTDGEGRFEFSGLPAGTYRVRAAAPAGHTGGEVMKISLPDRGCAPTRIYITPAGEISGRVTSADGSPVRDVRVALFSADGVTPESLANLDDRPPVSTYTDVGGRYHFVRLPAGRYYVVVSQKQGEGAGQTYLRTFFPNAASLPEAMAVTLAEGRKKSDVDVQLPPQ